MAGSGIQASIVIARPAAEVYAFYRDLTHVPLFAGDVVEANRLTANRYRWVVQGPLGFKLDWIIEVLDDVPTSAFRFAGLSPRCEWTVTFQPYSGHAATQVTTQLRFPAERLATLALTLAGKPPQQEVAANLARLKEFLEDGRVKTLTYAAAGKTWRTEPR